MSSSSPALSKPSLHQKQIFGGGRKTQNDPHAAISPQPQFDDDDVDSSVFHQSAHTSYSDVGFTAHQQRQKSHSPGIPSAHASPQRVHFEIGEIHRNQQVVPETAMFENFSTSPQRPLSPQQQRQTSSRSSRSRSPPKSPKRMVQELLGGTTNEALRKQALRNAEQRANEISHAAQMATMYSSRTNSGQLFTSSSSAGSQHRQSGSPVHHASNNRATSPSHTSHYRSTMGHSTALVPSKTTTQLGTKEKFTRQKAPVVTNVLHLNGNSKPHGNVQSPKRRPLSAQEKLHNDSQQLNMLSSVWKPSVGSSPLKTEQRAMVRANPQNYTVADVDHLREQLNDLTKEYQQLQHQHNSTVQELEERTIENNELIKRFENSQKSLQNAVSLCKSQELEIAKLRQALNGEVYDNSTLKTEFRNLLNVAKTELTTLRDQAAMQERSSHYVGVPKGNSDVEKSQGLIHPFDRKQNPTAEPTSNHHGSQWNNAGYQ